jgi:hypothetical protein
LTKSDFDALTTALEDFSEQNNEKIDELAQRKQHLFSEFPEITSAIVRELDDSTYDAPISTIKPQYIERFMKDVLPSHMIGSPRHPSHPMDSDSIRSSAATFDTARSVRSSAVTFRTAGSTRSSAGTFQTAESTRSSAITFRTAGSVRSSAVTFDTAGSKRSSHSTYISTRDSTISASNANQPTDSPTLPSL